MTWLKIILGKFNSHLLWPRLISCINPRLKRVCKVDIDNMHLAIVYKTITLVFYLCKKNLFMKLHTGCPRKKVTDLIMASAKDLA